MSLFDFYVSYFLDKLEKHFPEKEKEIKNLKKELTLFGLKTFNINRRLNMSISLESNSLLKQTTATVRVNSNEKVRFVLDKQKNLLDVWLIFEEKNELFSNLFITAAAEKAINILCDHNIAEIDNPLRRRKLLNKIIPNKHWDNYTIALTGEEVKKLGADILKLVINSKFR